MLRECPQTGSQIDKIFFPLDHFYLWTVAIRQLCQWQPSAAVSTSSCVWPSPPSDNPCCSSKHSGTYGKIEKSVSLIEECLGMNRVGHLGFQSDQTWHSVWDSVSLRADVAVFRSGRRLWKTPPSSQTSLVVTGKPWACPQPSHRHWYKKEKNNLKTSRVISQQSLMLACYSKEVVECCSVPPA